jgi:PAS domain S-box-containing protein
MLGRPIFGAVRGLANAVDVEARLPAFRPTVDSAHRGAAMSPAGNPLPLLSNVAPTAAQRRVALAVAAAALAIFVAAAPFADRQLPAVWAFLPIYQSIYVLVALVTATLLLAQFRQVRSRALLLLAGAYLFDALMAIAHALSFPGLFAPAGLLGAGPQTTAWLYFLWHGGFPVMVAGYALLKGRTRDALPPAHRADAYALAASGAVLALAVGLTALATAGHDWLPRIMLGNLDAPAKLGVATGVLLLNLAALGSLWRARPHSLLDLWLMVTVGAWIFDSALASVLNHARFDVGWYAGRLCGLLADGLVLVVLLFENSELYTELARLRDEEARRSQQQLRTSETRFKALFELAPLPLALAADDGSILAVNARFQAVLGDAPPGLAAGGDGIAPRECRITGKDGNARDLIVSRIPQPDGALIVFIDVTERREAEQALRDSEQRLQLLIDHAPAALAMLDAEMRYVAVSRRWRDDYALGEREILGHSHYEIFPEIPQDWKQAYRRAMSGEVVVSDQDRFERLDGTVQWLRWEARPWRTPDGGDGNGLVIFSEDITRLVAARNETAELNASLELRVDERTAELTAANGELESFAYAVSHDLRAPLRAMSGFSLALQEDFGAMLQPEARTYLDAIAAAAHRMSDLIDGILALSRSTRGEMRHDRVDVSALARRHLAELAMTEPARCVAAEIEDGLLVTGDGRMLAAALANLLDNAWKYTSTTAAPAIRVHAGEVLGHRGICVSDNGAGFDMAHAARLFQPFQRLHRQDEFPGIGIGLATVQRIVRRHGGDVIARAAPGEGATFCMTLAAAAARTDRESE